MRQRPSFFNYGTALVQANPELLCQPIDAAPDVTQFITETGPIPLLGADNFALNYCFQLTDLKIEFHPGNSISLPSELNPPLGEQRLAAQTLACVGLGCPSRDDLPLLDFLFELDRFALAKTSSTTRPTGTVQSFPSATIQSNILETLPEAPTQGPAELDPFPITVFPTRELDCSCVEGFATGQGKITNGPEGKQQITCIPHFGERVQSGNG
jgi:hypothetical protein